MTVWPSDDLPRPTPFEINPGLVVAYFLSPSAPEFELIEAQLRSALDEACSRVGIRGNLERAITSARPSIIHDEIWNALYNAPLLVFDVTGENASVMMELGVAAAWRLREQVLVIQNAHGTTPIPFNLLPARVLRYTLNPSGLNSLRRRALEAFSWSLSTLPLAELIYPHKLIFPFRYPENSDLLLTPSLCHRHRRSDGALVFGAPHLFRNSFALPHTGPRSRMRLEAELQFEDLQPLPPDPPWIGFKLLGSGVLMNYGVGAVLRSNGIAQITYQESERGPYRDPEIGRFAGFNPGNNKISFSANVGAEVFSVRIRSGRREVSHRLNLVKTAGYRPSNGICLIQAYRCRAAIHRLSLT